MTTAAEQSVSPSAVTAQSQGVETPPKRPLEALADQTSERMMAFGFASVNGGPDGEKCPAGLPESSNVGAEPLPATYSAVCGAARTIERSLVAVKKQDVEVGAAVPRATSEDGVVHTSETSGSRRVFRITPWAD